MQPRRYILVSQSGRDVSALTDDIKRRQLACMRFFIVTWTGWGRRRRLDDGRVVRLSGPPASGSRRLGNPSEKVLTRACAIIRRTCPEEAAAYRREVKRWREARRRLLATRTMKAWRAYLARVAYDSAIDARRRGTAAGFRNGTYRYRYSELGNRREERRRARRQMNESEAVLKSLRATIFVKMGVPKQFRSLA